MNARYYTKINDAKTVKQKKKKKKKLDTKIYLNNI